MTLEGNLRHAHALVRNFAAQVLFERLTIWTPEVQFTVFRKSLMITECQRKLKVSLRLDFVLKVLRRYGT
jgi:hypothetical protein